MVFVSDKLGDSVFKSIVYERNHCVRVAQGSSYVFVGLHSQSRPSFLIAMLATFRQKFLVRVAKSPSILADDNLGLLASHKVCVFMVDEYELCA